MSTADTVDTIEYPTSDGQPMGETALHRQWMIRIDDLLCHRYREQQVCIESDLLVYYERGNPKRFVVPDNFVVLNLAYRLRDIYKVWEEGSLDFVLEVTSKHTRRKDERIKPAIYAQIGVKEYFLYDPTADYLDPPLQGHRLIDGSMTPIPMQDGVVSSLTLGIHLRLEHGQLQMLDSASGERLLTALEAEQQEKMRQQQELARSQQRIRELEDQLRRQQDNE